MAVTQEKTAVVKFSTVGDAITGNINVNFIEWHSKTAAADDDLVITDTAGNILWVDTADGIDYKNFCPLKNTVNGIIILTMDSGEVFVYKAAELPGQY